MDRRTFLIGSGGAAVAAGAAAIGAVEWRSRSSAAAAATERVYGQTVLHRQSAAAAAPNVLFISLDDCNDWLGFLANHPGTSTPNLDALAAQSLVFTQAYCTAPMCNPARVGVLFGQQPDAVGVYDHSDDSFRHYFAMNKVTSSLIDDFWAAGYETLGAGKIFNNSEEKRWTTYRPTDYYVEGVFRRDPATKPDQFDPAWLSPYDGMPIGDGQHFAFNMIDFGPSGKAGSDEPDGQAASWVVDRLKEPRQLPFMLAFGVICTHVPWRIPQKFFDQHPLEGIVVPEFRPQDLAQLGNYARTYIVDPDHIFELLHASGLWERAVQAYQAAISYADDQVGRVLDALHASPYADDTIIVLWSDHGFHMGEKLHIEKFTLWERATRVPLLMHVPGKYTSRQTFDRPVSTLDLGPTVAELCGLHINQPNHAGRSVLPMVADPALADQRAPVMTWQPGNHAVRQGQWRYIRYRTGEAELYDHSNDPNEYVNVAGRPALAKTQQRLDALLPHVDPKTATAPPAVGKKATGD